MGRFISAGLAAIACFLAFAANASAAGEYEPNDTFNTAFGPLFSGVDISASLETTNDQDHFYFYVSQSTQVRFLLRNTSPNNTWICSRIFRQTNDGADYVSDTFLDGVDDGETKSSAVTLNRGKYYFWVGCPGAVGETYTFRLDPAGVFSDYSLIAQQCTDAHLPVETASATLRRLKSKLARASARHHRRAVKRLRPKVRAAGQSYRTALKSERYACGVPQ